MQLMIYAPSLGITTRNTAKCLRDRYHGADTVFLTALEEVESYLRQPSFYNKVLVLMPVDSRELEALTALSHLMRDTKLILVLPEEEPVKKARVHLMRPRFVTYIDCEPSQIAMVIDRLMAADSALPIKAVQC